jgi:hypothetical protein
MNRIRSGVCLLVCDTAQHFVYMSVLQPLTWGLLDRLDVLVVHRDVDSAKHSRDLTATELNGKLTTLESGGSYLSGEPADIQSGSRAALHKVLSARPSNSTFVSRKNLTIVKHEDGTDWLLGTGAFGKVRHPISP